MERTVPSTASEEVELYLRTYYSLLRSTADVQIRTLEEAHAGMKSLLHPAARDPGPDMSAFIYGLLRLPACMPDVNLVVMGQSSDVFARSGFVIGDHWQQVSAPARRRRCFFDGKNILACFIASRSDIDDIIPILTAYQIEWNKLHRLLGPVPPSLYLDERCREEEAARKELAHALDLSLEDLERWMAVWASDFGDNLERIASAPCNLSVRLLGGSLSEYRRATHAWWENIERSCPNLRRRPVYFVSSNTHSMANLLSGFALRYKDELVEYIRQPENDSLLHEWEDIQARNVPSSEENFLYYVLKKYQQTPQGKKLVQEGLDCEQESGIERVPSEHYFDVEAQVIDLSRIKQEWMDPRLRGALSQKARSNSLARLASDLEISLPAGMAQSDALILNIDYPLGLAAYNILSVVAENVGSVMGVYVMGKSATLNGVIGDVLISNVVHDEHSQNTYLFPNCVTAADVAPYLVFGTVLDNQKTVSVQGTFLQNAHYMEVFYREGYTDIEMEAGPYLSAVYEMYRPKRHPSNEIVNLYGLPFDLGLIHYASDTPLSKGKNLGAGSLSYFGMDSTYAATLAILSRILSLEKLRLS
jgi:hypothetical protein